jgi:uncharacterized protein (DUF736 family)
MKKLGALWKGKNKTKDGRTYLRGEIEVVAGVKTKVMVFPVKEKKQANGPDYEIVLSEPQKVPMTQEKQVVKSEDFLE